MRIRPEETLSAEDTYTEPAEFYGDFNVSIIDEFVGIIHLQASFNYSSGSPTWVDIEGWEDEVRDEFHEAEYGVYYRLGFGMSH